MRVAILLANNDESAFSARFPDDGQKIAARIATLRADWSCRVWGVKDHEFPSLTDADAFIITGSPASIHDPLPWISRLADLIRTIDEARVPLVGICFGHQLIASALGGEVGRNVAGWRFGATETQYSVQRDWMNPARGSLRLFSSHSEQVTRLPLQAARLGTAINCPNAAFAVGMHIMTTQYHPEFSHDFMVALALEYEGDLPAQVLKAGSLELSLPTDGNTFFQWLARFIESSAVGPHGTETH